MRIWSFHPKYLDPKGLVAIWRETLLAQKVLIGKTKGYKKHPQLIRFKNQSNSISAIGKYLLQIFIEAKNRGYKFNKTKIMKIRFNKQINVNCGQIEFEWSHFKQKVKNRNKAIYNQIKGIKKPELNPIFKIKPGKIETWEKAISPANKRFKLTRGS